MVSDTDNTSNKRLQICRKMSKDEIFINVPSPREDMIKTAVAFILYPEVAGIPSSEKEAYLKRKGMTPEEIRIAFERSSGVLQNSPPSFSSSHNNLVPSTPYHYYPVTTLQKFRDILQIVALVTGVAYGVVYFIKKYIIPFLFGKPKKPKEVESVVADSLAALRAEVEKVHSDLEKVVTVQAEQHTAVRNLGDIKSEIATVKGILLSRHQFPSVNLAGSTSIPAWQMAACPDSGDRSSEAEIALPNSNGGSQGSDSSLEMIKEVEVAETES